MQMPFGKFKGLQLCQLPHDYLAWLYDLRDLHQPLRRAVAKEWRRRQRDAHWEQRNADSMSEPMGNLDAEDKELLAELFRAGYRALALKHHPDIGGDPDTMRRLNLLMERLRGAVAA